MKSIQIFAFSLFCVSSGYSVSTNINAVVTSNSKRILNNAGVALDAGVSTANGDGALFEIGYFTDGVANDTALDNDTSNFRGQWVAITGAESNNPSLVTTIGDFISQTGSIPIPDGEFSIGVTFDSAVANTTNDLPADGVQLALRFYDGTTRAGSMYNTVTYTPGDAAAALSSTWRFKALSDPAPVPAPDLDLNNNAITFTWEDNSNPFRTTLVPEPSTTTILGLGGLVLLLRRRR